MRILRLGVAKGFMEGHTVGKWQTQDFNLHFHTPKPPLPTTVLHGVPIPVILGPRTHIF